MERADSARAVRPSRRAERQNLLAEERGSDGRGLVTL